MGRNDGGLSLTASAAERRASTVGCTPAPPSPRSDRPLTGGIPVAMERRLSARTHDVARPRDVTGFTDDQLVSDVLDHVQRWRLGERRMSHFGPPAFAS